MITICTNDETSRSTLESALCRTTATAEQIATILESGESDIWTEVLGRLAFEFQTDWYFQNWNGGKRDQFGYRFGLAHSDLSQEEANMASEALDWALEAELPSWVSLATA